MDFSWNHLNWMTCNYTRLSPSLARLEPIAIIIADGRWVLIHGLRIADRSDADKY